MDLKKLLLLGLPLVGLAFLLLFLFQPTPTAQRPERSEAAPVADTAPEAASLGERETLREVAAEDAPYDPRVLKAGPGTHRLRGLVVDEFGQPVPNAWVASFGGPYPLFDFVFEPSELLEHPLELSLEPIASVRADAEGRFDLDGLLGRTTWLVARAPQRLNRGRIAVSPLRLDDDEPFLVPTVPGAAVTGRVVDEFGAPVANAEVFVGPSLTYVLQAIRNRDVFLERRFTDGQGRFELEAVPAGAVLSVLALDGATHPGFLKFGPLRPDSERTLEVRLAETGSLSGRVETSSGEAAVGAEVLAVPLDFRLLPAVARDLPAWTTRTSGDGSFRFDRLPRRQYFLVAQGAQGRAMPVAARVSGRDSTVAKPLVLRDLDFVSGRVVDGSGRPRAGVTVSLASLPTGNLGGGGVGGIPDAIEVFTRVGGEVLPALLPKLTQDVTDADGSFRLPAWPGAALVAETANGTGARFELPTGDADTEDGAVFVLVLPEPGVVRGRVTDPEGRPVPLFSISLDPRSPEWFVQRTRELESPELEAVPPPDESAPPPPWSDLEANLAEGEVLVRPRMRALDGLSGLRFLEDPNGAFELTGVLPMHYALTARAAGWAESESVPLQVRDGEVVEVEATLRAGGTLRGRVIAEGTREPISGALVQAGSSDDSRLEALLLNAAELAPTTRSGADGSFELVGIPAGFRYLNVFAEGFAPRTLKGKPFEAGEVREDVVVELRGGATIQGTVRDRHGNPLPSRMVLGFAPDSQDAFQTPTDEDGSYRAEHVVPGNYFLVTAALDDESLLTGDLMAVFGGGALANVYVKEGQTATVDITDPTAGGCHLTGTLVDADGLPIARSGIFVRAKGAGMLDLRMASARTDAEGRFSFRSLAPGDYDLTVFGGSWDGELDLEVPDLPEADVVVRVPRGRVTGAVVREGTGEAAPGVTVMLVREDAEGDFFSGMIAGGRDVRWGNTDERGRFEFTGVPPGEYHVEARADFGFRLRGGAPGTEGPPLGKAVGDSFRLGLDASHDAGVLRLPVSGGVHLVVQAPGGQPLSIGFRVRAEPLDEDGEGGSTWGRGEATLGGLAAGSYRVRVTADGWCTAETEPVEVRDGELAEVVVALEKGVELRARIRNADGTPVDLAALEVYGDDGRRMPGPDAEWLRFQSRFGGEDGTFAIGTYAPGSYRVVAESTDGRKRQASVFLSEGGDGLVELTF